MKRKRATSLFYDPYRLSYNNSLNGRVVTVSDWSRKSEALVRRVTLAEAEWKALLRSERSAVRAAKRVVLNTPFYSMIDDD